MSLGSFAGVSLIATLAFVTGDLGTRLVSRLLATLDIVDVPGDRSSHLRPTLRGGGAAIVAAGIAAAIASCVVGWMSPRVGAALIGGGGLIAVVGWLDDIRGVRWELRLLAQFVAAAWALVWLGGYPALDLGLTRLEIGRLGTPLALLGIVWGTNFFNFMDGIDGIAASQATFVGLVGGILLLAAGGLGLGAVALAVAFAAAGFLRHNWMPARVFLGDVGSTWLGYTLCVIAVASANLRAVPMIVWGILLGVFVFDATVTLARRVLNGHAANAPHREHAFCRATRWGWSHAGVTLRVGGLNLVLAALAVTAWAWRPFILPAVACGLVMLIAAYCWVESRVPMTDCRAGSRPDLTLIRNAGPPEEAFPAARPAPVAAGATALHRYRLTG